MAKHKSSKSSHSCRVYAIGTIVSLVISIAGAVMIIVDVANAANTLPDPSQPISSDVVNPVTMTGYVLSGLGGALFFVFLIMWIICAVKQ